MKKQIILLTGLLLLLTAVITKTQAKQWEVYGTMPLPVAGAEAVVVDGKIYFLGGWSDSTWSTTTLLQIFDPYANSWNSSQLLDVPREHLVAAEEDGAIYYFGGASPDSLNPFQNTPYDSAAVKRLLKWDHTAPNDIAAEYAMHDVFDRMGATGLIKDKTFYIFGGSPSEETEIASDTPYIIEYDLAQNRLEHSADTLNTSVSQPNLQMSALYGDYIFIYGGVFYGITERVFRYNTTEQTLAQIHPGLLTPRAGGRAVAVPADGVIYVIGGFNENNNALRSTEICIPTEEQHIMISGPSLNIARSMFSAVLHENRIFVFGGYDQDGNLVPEIEILYLEGVTSVGEEAVTPGSFELLQNYPNPFNPATEIGFRLPTPSPVTLDIYSTTGEKVMRLASGLHQAGYHSYRWNGMNDNGSPMPSGVYFYRLADGEKAETTRMLLLR